jgi:hypothetical protein
MNRAGLAASLLLVSLGSVAAAATRLAGPQQMNPKPPLQRSYVADSTGALVATDRRYVADIAATWPGDMVVDVVMQQCSGGGFAEPFETAAQAGANPSIPNVTFVSASTYSESAWSEVKNNIFGTLTHIDNFTRAWVDDARSNSAAAALTGMFRLARSAAYGRTAGLVPVIAAVSGDPYESTMGRLRARHRENPQYYSPDPPINQAMWVNNGRTVNGNGRYAILVAWDIPGTGHDVDIIRVYRTLRDVYAIPAANIVVLYGGNANGARLTNYAAMAPSNQNLNSGAGVVVDGPNTRAAWLQALGGALFTGAAPAAGARLLLYNTGHGGSSNTIVLGMIGGAGVLSYDLAPGSFDETQPEAPDVDGSVSLAATDPDGTDLVQVSARRTLGPDPRLRVEQGAAPYPLVEVFPPDVRDLGELLPEPGLHHYQVRIQHSDLDPATPGIAVELSNLPETNPDLVAALRIGGGNQEFIGVVPADRAADECPAATPVGEGLYVFSTAGATNDGGDACGSGATASDLWFLYRPSASGMATASACGTAFDGVLSFHPACGQAASSCGASTCGSGLSGQVVAGETYLIRIAGLAGATGNGALNISLVPQDSDGDGTPDPVDNCVAVHNSSQADGDTDTTGDACDRCPYFATFDNTDTNVNGRGNACECGDQSGDGLVTVADLVAISQALFNPALVTPLCDGNNDGRCNVADIVAANAEIFSPGETSTCSRQPVSQP